MNKSSAILAILLASVAGASAAHAENAQQISPSVTLVQGPVNGVFIRRDGHTLVIYGDPAGTLQKADMVLFTHNRRDVVWAGRRLVGSGATSVVPGAEAASFTHATAFWTAFARNRFHDYQQQSTKVPVVPLRVDRTVGDGDDVQWQDLSLHVIGTPGYTRGAVSYLVKVDGLTYAFVGDTIYGDGHLLDLYSLQDAVAEAQIGGYHGYAGRIGELITSLKRIADRKPDILIPAHGPVIRDPQASIARLIERLRAVYENYLSVSAGRWYFKDNYDILATRALGSADRVRWMPWATTIEKAPPDWIVPIQNSRLVLSTSGAGLLIDCGSQAIIDEVKKLRDAGRLTAMEGLFITHYHDDHTEQVNALRDQFKCPVYVTPIMEDILRNPGAYRLPAMTAKPITDLTVVPDGHKMTWREFTFTFYDFPGQTIYHDALLVERRDGETIFFIGDSFTPSGFDDYCLLNRNIAREGQGYFYCLDMLGRMPPGCLLINQHVLEPFRFDKQQLAHMAGALKKRKELLTALFGWDEPNYGIDERWARFYPYSQSARPGERVTVQVRIMNHSAESHEYTVTPHVCEGFQAEPKQTVLSIGPGQESGAAFEITVPARPKQPVAVVTADVAFGEWRLRHWCEAVIEVQP